MGTAGYNVATRQFHGVLCHAGQMRAASARAEKAYPTTSSRPSWLPSYSIVPVRDCRKQALGFAGLANR